jgi:hypothetical protein
MTYKKPLARRTFLRGALGGGAVALAACRLLDAMLPTVARPRRRARASCRSSASSTGPTARPGTPATARPRARAATPTSGPRRPPARATPRARCSTPLAAHQVSVTGLEPHTDDPPTPARSERRSHARLARRHDRRPHALRGLRPPLAHHDRAAADARPVRRHAPAVLRQQPPRFRSLSARRSAALASTTTATGTPSRTAARLARSPRS